MNRMILYIIALITLNIPILSSASFENDTASKNIEEMEALEKEVPTVEISEDLQKAIGVRTEKAEIRSLVRTVRTVGRVTFDEARLYTVNIKFEGWVKKLYAEYTGKTVSKGDTLAEVWSPEFTSLQLEYLNLLKWKSGQIPRFQRIIEFDWADRYGTTGKFISYDPELLVEVAKQKFQLWEISDAQVKQIEKNRKPLETFTINSPADGVVYSKPAFEGTRIAPGEKLFDIVDLSSVWVIADFYEYEIPHVAVGDRAYITMSYFPEKSFDTRVDFIYPTLSGQTRTARVRFVLDNHDFLLKPDMFVDVSARIDLGKRLSIPAESFIDKGDQQMVYVDIGDGYFQPRQVRLGARADNMIEVFDGVKPGESVAVHPLFLIDSEAKLKGVVRQ